MTRVLLTGASGYVGKPALAALLARGHEVHAVARRRGAEDAIWHEVDLLEPGAARALANEVKASHLLHLGWFAEHGAFWSSPLNHAWLAASVELVDAFRRAGGERAAVAGTCVEYTFDATPCDERTTPIAPATLYGLSKDALRRALDVCGRATGLSWAWGRLFFSYGPRERSARLVASLIDRVRRGEEAPCTSGEQIRDFLHVDDVAGALVALLESRAEGPVNIGSGEPVRVRDLALRIGELLERPELIRIGALPSRSDDPPHIVARIERLREEVGFTPRLSLDEGLRDTIASRAS